jgi:FlaA1/EpsC-like NDP-sugar epimerase
MLPLRNRHHLALDGLFLAVAGALSFAAYHETADIAPSLRVLLAAYVGVALPLRLAALWRMGLYTRLWRYAGQADVELLGAASIASAAVGFAVGTFLLPLAAGGGWRVPVGVLALDALLGALVLAAPRVAMLRRPRRGRRAEGAFKRVLIGGLSVPHPGRCFESGTGTSSRSTPRCSRWLRGWRSSRASKVRCSRRAWAGCSRRT